MATLIPIGTYLISGIPVYLQLELRIREGNSLEFYVPFPSNYPPTQVRETLGNKGLVRLIINYKPSGYWHSPREVEMLLRNYNISTSRPTLNLSIFYLLPREENIPVTSDEDLMLRGLGKKVLCLALPTVMQHYNMVPEDLISLSASGGDVRTEEDQQRVQDYAHSLPLLLLVHRAMIAEGFLENMLDDPEKAKDYRNECKYLMKQSKLYLAQMIVSIENNVRLVSYY